MSLSLRPRALTGPCQFPTLGFVVARYNKVKNFKAELFWYIYLSLTRPSDTMEDPIETEFTWRRGHLFDLQTAWALYEAALEHETARVTKVTSKETKKLCVSACLPRAVLTFS